MVKRKVTVNITDTLDVRAKIDGYIATIYTPGISGLKLKSLPPNTRSFTFGYLFVNTTYVIEVTSYRGRVASERSKGVRITTESPGMSLYKYPTTNEIQHQFLN